MCTLSIWARSPDLSLLTGWKCRLFSTHTASKVQRRQLPPGFVITTRTEAFFLPLSIIADRQNEWQWTVNLFTQNSLNGHISRTPRTHYPLSSAIMLKLSFQIFTTNNLQHSRLQSSAESLPRCPVLSFLVCLLLMGFFFFFFNLDKEGMFLCCFIFWLVCQQVTWKKHLKLGRRMNLSPE